MPRLSQGKHRYTKAQKRAKANRYRVTGYKKFLDPFPLGFGTLPEKIVYYALSSRGIYFYYLNDVTIDIPELELFKVFQADFVIPDAKIIIEIQGSHWHSMPKVMEEDAFKFAMYTQAGYKPLAWWDYDILSDVNKLFAATPELQTVAHAHSGTTSYELTPKKRTKTDSSKGIRTLNKRRAQRLVYRKKPATVKTRKQNNYGSYRANTSRR